MFYHKNIGETTAEFSKRISLLHGGVKTCACGKLDPMARGITRVLIGSETKQMGQHLNSDKTYEFYIVPGISTGSDDIMGLIENSSHDINTNNIDNILEYMDTVIFNLDKQKFHHYSAINLKKNNERHPLWYWYNKGLLNEDEIPEKAVKVYSLDFMVLETMKVTDYLNNVLENLSKITDKDKFRIDNIVEKWKSINSNKYIFLLKFKMKVSSGFYIRMISKQIKRDLGIPVHIYDIRRTNVY
jgi:tRNA pseudouridine(55) synthase